MDINLHMSVSSAARVCVSRWAAAQVLCRPSWRHSLDLLLFICKQLSALNANLFSLQLQQPTNVRLFVRCTDVNPAAAQCTAKTASCNDVSLQPVITSLVSFSVCYGHFIGIAWLSKIGLKWFQKVTPSPS